MQPQSPFSHHYYALIMAGGGGTRLWPMSRKNTPKQLLPFSKSQPNTTRGLQE